MQDKTTQPCEIIMLQENTYVFEQRPKLQKSPEYLFQDAKIAVVIPAYNEMDTIGQTLDQIPRNLSKNQEIVVINDGSTDKTKEVAEKHQCVVLSFSKNLGNGAAVRAGFQYCLKNHFEIIVTLDADGQHNPTDIPRFIQPIIENHADFTIGNRYKYKYNMDPFRKVFSKSMSILYSILLKTRIDDPTNGFRGISSRVLENVTLESNYSSITETLFKVAPHSRVMCIPTKVRPRRHGSSFVRYGKYLEKTLIVILKYYVLAKIERLFAR